MAFRLLYPRYIIRRLSDLGGLLVLYEKRSLVRWLRTVSIVLLVHTCAVPQQAPPQPDPVIERIMGAAMTRGGAMDFLETLTDTIGGRVTGSPQSQATAELILKTLKDAGFDKAYIEEFPLKARWQRGPASRGNHQSSKTATPHRVLRLVTRNQWTRGIPARFCRRHRGGKAFQRCENVSRRSRARRFDQRGR